jgi:hypothetical protein
MMVRGLQKYAGALARQRRSGPKLQVFNTALQTAPAGLTLKEARADPAVWGHLVASAVSTHLANAAASGDCELFYWRDGAKWISLRARDGL